MNFMNCMDNVREMVPKICLIVNIKDRDDMYFHRQFCHNVQTYCSHFPSPMVNLWKFPQILRFVYTFLKLDDYDLEYEAISIDIQPCAVHAYCLE